MQSPLDVIDAARRAGQKAALGPENLPPDRAAAYQMALAQVDRPLAWKIGASNHWSRMAFGIDHIFFGPLTGSEVRLGGDSLDLSGLVEPLVEPEIVVQIADPDAPNIRGFVSAIELGLEIPATVLPEHLKGHLNAQIVDRAGVGALWVETGMNLEPACLDNPITGSFQHNNESATSWSSANLTGTVRDILSEFRSLAHLYGARLNRGQWIATGGVCKPVPVVPADVLTLEIQSCRRQLSFIA